MKEDKYRDFPGGPVVKTPSFQCREHVFPSLVGELRSHMMLGVAKKKKKEKETRHKRPLKSYDSIYMQCSK